MIPLILGALALGGAVLGVGAAAAGIEDMNEAKEIGDDAQKRHEYAVSELEAHWEATNELAQEYGQFLLDVHIYTIERFVDFIERNIGKAKARDNKFLEGLDGISAQQVKEYKAVVIEAQEYLNGGYTAIKAGVTAGKIAVNLVGLFGTASTGTTISGLSGAAATNATLAWFGGGSLAAGGGGMALGTLVLGGITVGPTLLVSGFVLAGKGEEQLTKAREYEAQVNIAIANIYTTIDFLGQIQQRIIELASLVEDLNNRAVVSLNNLESRPFDKNRDASKFQQVALLVKALAEIMKTPVLDSEGQLHWMTQTTNGHFDFIGA